MPISKHIPNAFTTFNLIAGCLGLLVIYQGNHYQGALFILVGAVFDFLDGFSARLLHARSEIGKQLDSLADLVTFGLLPAFLLYHLLEQQQVPVISYLALLVVVGSAFRLAKFNIDDSQEVIFKGLPTPASAFLVAGLVFVEHADWTVFDFIYQDVIGLTIFTIAITYFLNAPLTFLSLKIERFKLKGNEYMILLIIFSLVCLLFYGVPGIFPATLFYVLLSLLRNIFTKKELS
jgi:CDP-diacylglycerol--serine O-phosphatidyltransferase